jgi:DNA-binding MarR family transcriptional regulator
VATHPTAHPLECASMKATNPLSSTALGATGAIDRMLRVGSIISDAVGSNRFEWQMAEIFLQLCVHGGDLPMQQLEKITGWGQTSVSRNVSKLGRGIGERPGAGLVEAFEDPHWRRRKIVRLTGKGVVLRERINAILQSDVRK